MSATTTEQQPLLGRCREQGCDYAIFATDDQVKAVDSWKQVNIPGQPYRVSTFGIYARCPSRHKVFPLKHIKGTFSKDHKCDSRCLNAKGHDCTCSCGGANHGRGYAITVVAAREPGHIGEVGKNIVGYVKVTRIITRERSTLYSFVTDNGDVVKCFQPLHKPVAFEEGQRYKIRAKVFRHDDDERFGKSTIVDSPEILDEQLKMETT